ncbi:MAG TPA: hypothetical protein VFS40_14380 [Gemmatimonadales bacterium]|nr:hypothetical protein [Gemmatimonadales bacterium]
MSSRGTAVVLLVAAFLVGLAAGAGAMAVRTRARTGDATVAPAARTSEGYLDRLTRDLALTPVQRDSVRAVLERHRPQMDSLWQSVRPRFETLRTTIRSEIRTHLTPEQRARYEQLLERRRHDGPSPPPR